MLAGLGWWFRGSKGGSAGLCHSPEMAGIDGQQRTEGVDDDEEQHQEARDVIHQHPHNREREHAEPLIRDEPELAEEGAARQDGEAKKHPHRLVRRLGLSGKDPDRRQRIQIGVESDSDGSG